MGIINVTPDSYFSYSRYEDPSLAVAYGKQLVDEGADWLDIGGESTRPFSHPISEEEELRRVMPVIEALAPDFPVSIDTRKAGVAARALAAGARLINDTSGFTDPKMREVVANSEALCCVMHSQGPPATMQLHPYYPNGVLADVLSFFTQQLSLLEQEGISRRRILLDPGIGFGKSVDDCWALVRSIAQFHTFGCSVLLGISRKSFLQKTLNRNVDETLPASLICATVCTMQAPSWLRVHDVKAHRELLTLLEHAIAC